jgi:hypothetical protein
MCRSNLRVRYNEMSGGIEDGDVDDDGADVHRCRAFKIQVFI